MDEVGSIFPSMTLNCSHGTFFVVFFQYDELTFAEDQVLCTTLRYDAFTDDESMIGDAVRIQRTPRSMPAACSLTRTWSKAPAPRSRVTGSEHLGTHSESRVTVWTPAEVADRLPELNLCDYPGKSYDFTFVTFMDIYRVWSGISWFPRVSGTLQWT